MKSVNTVLVDHESIFTECLAYALSDQRQDIKVLGSFKGGNAVLDLDIDETVDLIIMDLNLLDIDGLDLIPLLRKRSSGVKILVLTKYSKSKLVKEAFKKGADGYLLKSDNLEDLHQAIDDVLDSKTFLGEGLRITPPVAKDQDPPSFSESGTVYEDRYMIKDKLTKREQEILVLIAQAKNNKEIAAELYISDQTVGVHRKNMMRKLGVHSTVNLVKLAIEYQLVD